MMYSKKLKIYNSEENFNLLYDYLIAIVDNNIENTPIVETYYLNYLNNKKLNEITGNLLKLRSVPTENLGFVKTNFSKYLFKIRIQYLA